MFNKEIKLSFGKYSLNFNYSFNKNTKFSNLLEYVSFLYPNLNLCQCFCFSNNNNYINNEMKLIEYNEINMPLCLKNINYDSKCHCSPKFKEYLKMSKIDIINKILNGDIKGNNNSFGEPLEEGNIIKYNEHKNLFSEKKRHLINNISNNNKEEIDELKKIVNNLKETVQNQKKINQDLENQLKKYQNIIINLNEKIKNNKNENSNSNFKIKKIEEEESNSLNQLEQHKEDYRNSIEFKTILILIKSYIEIRDEKNKLLTKRFFILKWYMQIKKLKEREEVFEEAINVIDKKLIIMNVNVINDVSVTHKFLNAARVARASILFTQLRKISGDWRKIRIRILDIMEKYLKREEEKKVNYLKRKLFQWKKNSINLKKEVLKIRLAQWIENSYKTSVSRKNWKNLSDKYDFYINKSLLYHIKNCLRNWLKLRDMSEKIRYRFNIVGIDQFKEGIKYKKILILMRVMFENWNERNKFLSKRYIIRKWYMQVKKLIKRDDTFDKAMEIIDKRYLTITVNTIDDVSRANKVLKVIPVARAVDFFTQLRMLWGNWDKYRRRIMAKMGNFLENEDKKINNIIKRKLLQWKENACNLTKEINRIKLQNGLKIYIKLQFLERIGKIYLINMIFTLINHYYIILKTV